MRLSSNRRGADDNRQQPKTSGQIRGKYSLFKFKRDEILRQSNNIGLGIRRSVTTRRPRMEDIRRDSGSKPVSRSMTQRSKHDLAQSTTKIDRLTRRFRQDIVFSLYCTIFYSCAS